MPKKRRVAESQSEVRIGTTGEHHYIAVRPPLSEQELTLLVDSGVILNPELVEIIPGGKLTECSFIKTGTDLSRTQQTAFDIASTLRGMRDGHVRHNLDPVRLVGYQSTPFKPYTDRQ